MTLLLVNFRTNNSANSSSLLGPYVSFLEYYDLTTQSSTNETIYHSTLLFQIRDHLIISPHVTGTPSLTDAVVMNLGSAFILNRKYLCGGLLHGFI